MSTTQYQRAGQLRGTGDGLNPYALTTPQKLMVFVLSMALFGLSNIILEVIPDVTIGPFDVSIAYFVFVPLTMAALFSPFWVALGAPLGEIIFTDLLMGDFSGLAEIEGFIQMFLAIFIAGSIIRNPRNRVQVALGAILIVFIDKLLSAVVDLSKVWIGVEEAEFVEGLPESMLLIEGVGFGIDLIISGLLFGILPALWLVPALHGRIEPLMGMRPRVAGEPIPGQGKSSGPFVGAAVLLAVASFFFAFLEAWDVSVGVWEPELLEEFGMGFLWVSVAAIIILVAVALALFRAAQKKDSRRTAVAGESASVHTTGA